MSNSSKTNTLTPKRILLIIIAFGTIWLLAVILGCVAYLNNWQEAAGQFGDFFGSINALFSGLALAGVILSLVMQRDELRLQREEMRLTRNEMENQRVIMERNERSVARQTANNEFFTFFNAHMNLICQLEVKNYLTPSNPNLRGTQVFTNFRRHTERAYKFLKNPPDELRKLAFQEYPIQGYLNSLEQLLKIVDSLECDNTDEYFEKVYQATTPDEKFLIDIAVSPNTYPLIATHFLPSKTKKSPAA